MAKLSAHGKELLRRELESEDSAPDSSTDWTRKTRAYMSDGTVLQKYDVHFKPDTFRPKGESYSYGWKLYGKLKTTKTPAEHIESIVAGINAKPDTKWKIISGGPAPVVLCQSRIMRAIESGENRGFCKACGASQDGCEPDARNYVCDVCGQPEVYGAEECLIAG